jgi:hypothetical protein
MHEKFCICWKGESILVMGLQHMMLWWCYGIGYKSLTGTMKRGQLYDVIQLIKYMCKLTGHTHLLWQIDGFALQCDSQNESKQITLKIGKYPIVESFSAHDPSKFTKRPFLKNNSHDYIHHFQATKVICWTWLTSLSGSPRLSAMARAPRSTWSRCSEP